MLLLYYLNPYLRGPQQHQLGLGPEQRGGVGQGGLSFSELSFIRLPDRLAIGATAECPAKLSAAKNGAYG